MSREDKSMTSDTQTKKHPFHMVQPSPWPLVSSMAALLFGIGAVLYMHDHGPWLVLGAFLALGVILSLWWRDVIRESSIPGQHTPEVHTGFRIGMGLFIMSEVMFFAAFFWAYFHASLSPTEATGHMWPPKGIETLNPFDLPYLNTLLLLLSGTTVTWAHFDLSEGNIKSMIEKTGYTVILGALFLCVQAYEYHHASFGFKDGIYPSTFYMATGFHGFHVFIGTVFLLVTYYRAKAGHFKSDDHFGFEAAAWYWHFVDVVWLFLFISIYWWGSGH